MANRLANAQSPYLRQHKDNPVDWFEWGEAAFAQARARDLPILLSIGYAACHWCHVMAHESFEDPAIAEIMNQKFVNIKVDREERPDIDAVYMAATQAIAGHGGWPMTVFLNHELQPYYAGTYFPPAAQHGLPSFRELLEAMSDAWLNQRPMIDEAVEQITEHLRAQNSKLNVLAIERTEVLEQAVVALREEFDLSHAGFGGAPKFPPHTTLQFLLRYLAQKPNPEVMGWVERTAIKMASGGMYDQLGGGFARYSVDNRWIVPHFEKMLYDNALLLDVYAELFLRTKNPRYEKVLRDTSDFLIRELRTDQGGFASSLDADSEGEEGRYYVFDQQDLKQALGEDWELAGQIFKVAEQPSFDDGKSVLQFDEAEVVTQEKCLQLQQKLLQFREQRIRPERDDKLLTGWNGWAITGLIRAAVALRDSSVAEHARAALEFLLEKHLVSNELYRSSLNGEVSQIPGQLEDWSGLGQALLTAHGYFGEKRYFELALWIGNEIPKRFGAEVLFDTEERFNQTPIRPRTLSDAGYPSAHSITAELFRQLWLLTGEQHFSKQANAILDEQKGLMARAPRATSAALRVLVGMTSTKEYAVLGVGSNLHQIVLAQPDDGSVLSCGNPGDTPLLSGRSLVRNKPTVYICENFSCKLPVTDEAQLLDQLTSNS